MNKYCRIVALSLLIFLSVSNVHAQPVWTQGTPSVPLTDPLSITMNYAIDRAGTVYIIVYNYNNISILSSATVKARAISGPSGNLVATAVLTVSKTNINKLLKTVLSVKDPDQVHTIYIVAADGKAILQTTPIRLNATTLPCPKANPGIGGNECDLNFILNAVPVYGKGIWTKVSGPGNVSFSPNANTANATVTVTAYGSYIFRWTESQGICISSGDIIVNFFLMAPPDAGNGGDECDLNFVLGAVSGSSETIGTWSMTSGTGTAVFTPNANTPDATVLVSEPGTKVFTWTVSNGSCSNSSNVTVNFYQQPVANAGSGGNNCGLEYYLNAVPSTGTGTWTRVSGPGSATFSPNNHTPNAKVTVTAYGTYVFRWTEVNGPCSARASITVGFSATVSANGGNGGDECDMNFTLNAVPGTGTGTWSKINGPGNATFTPNANQYNAVVTVTQFGSYDFAWTEVNNNCSSTDIIRVVFHSPPLLSAGKDTAMCKGSSLKLKAEGTGTFLWSPGNLLDNPGLQEPVATPPVTTTFTVQLTDQWKCINSDQVIVAVRSKPLANAGPDQTLDFMFETILEASEPNTYETGEWKVLSGTAQFENINDNTTKVTGLSIGNNILIWSVANGLCGVASDSVLIKISDLLIPTLITPNMDGNNDYFVIRGIESFGKTEFEVFNRWGARLFISENYSNNWDGKDNDGNLLEDGTYYYILKSEKYKPHKGFIVIKH